MCASNKRVPCLYGLTCHWRYNVNRFDGHSCRVCKIGFLCFDVTICDLVHDIKAVYGVY